MSKNMSAIFFSTSVLKLPSLGWDVLKPNFGVLKPPCTRTQRHDPRFVTSVGSLNLVFGGLSAMVLALRLSSAIRYTTSISVRYFSSMTAPAIVLPHEEIEQLWFGGLDLKPGLPPSMDTMKRWFTKDPEFDASCK